MDKANHTIVVTGASRGIGKSLCQSLLLEGWNVVGCSRGEASITHPRYTHVAADVSNEKQVANIFSQVRKLGFPLYSTLNNAGMASMNHCLLTPRVTMEKLLNVNVIGTMLCCREAGKLMAQQNFGRIINFGSVACVYFLEGEAVYTASKAAVEAYTKVIANELGDCGITVNAISPNPVKTDLIAGVSREKMDALVDRQAIKRYGTFEDVMEVVHFLLQPANTFTTGQIIYLGGP